MNIKIPSGQTIEPGSLAYDYFFKGLSYEKKPSFEYNTELLNYACISEVNTDFTKTVGASLLVIISVVSIISIILLYTSFKITYAERIKELGILASIGMNSYQRSKILKTEIRILGTIRNYYRLNNRYHCI